MFTNCKQSNSTTTNLPNNPNQNEQNTQLRFELLAENTYNFLGKNYKAKTGKIISNDGSTPIYVEWLSNCQSNCPTVVISNPYAGIDWSDDQQDKVWLSKPNSTGAFYADSEGPIVDLIDQSLGKIFFQSQTLNQTSSLGAIYLENNLSVLIVNNRFYRGRNLKIYIEEFKKSVKFFIENKYIDSSKMAFWGASLGGMISTYAALDTAYPPKALALITPLLDYKKFYAHSDSITSKVSDNTVKQAYLDFFAPYLRRIIDFSKGTPEQKPDVFALYDVNYIANNLNSNVLMIHDTWDTLVPYQATIELYDLIKNKSHFTTNLVLHQHSSEIIWNTFKLDHAQESEGYNNDNANLFYPAFILNQLLSADQSKWIYYDYIKVAKMLVEFRAAEGRGQNISWLKSRFKDLCHENIRLYDTTMTIGEVSGRYFVQQVMKNIWNFDKPENQICSELDHYFQN